MMKCVLFFVSWCFGTLSCCGESKFLHGEVIKVSDGDTINILVGEEVHKIRLVGIDAPELSQPHGNASRIALKTFLSDKRVRVRIDGKDRYRRILGCVFVGDVNVNHWLVEHGWAWHFKKYDQSKILSDLEVSARTNKRGLWVGENSIPPWDHRSK